MTTVWFATVVVNLSDLVPSFRSGTVTDVVLVLEKAVVRVAEARIGVADASSPPRVANTMAGTINPLTRRIVASAVEKPALPAAKGGMRRKCVISGSSVGVAD